jgi:hypothetical protein
MIFKNRPPKAALLECFKTRFSRLSELIPCLIRDYDGITIGNSLSKISSELMPCLIRDYDCESPVIITVSMPQN